ncbi:MAG: hypothetical protein Q9M23_05550 [Mariprofundaceae bacterium]|nr:hypothetical protein [Mariprofundaceae bacterium]
MRIHKAGLMMFVCFAALLISACDYSRPAIGYPDQQSQAFNVYARNCSECHAPPLPDAHPAAEWPNVITRMQEHLVQRSMAPIAAADINVLRGYLETHAAKEKP